MAAVTAAESLPASDQFLRVFIQLCLRRSSISPVAVRTSSTVAGSLL